MFGNAASHPEPEQLRRLGLGQLEDAEARVVEDHIAGCDVCAVTLSLIVGGLVCVCFFQA